VPFHGHLTVQVRSSISDLSWDARSALTSLDHLGVGVQFGATGISGPFQDTQDPLPPCPLRSRLPPNLSAFRPRSPLSENVLLSFQDQP
jgi:hypothetical protein